MADVRPFPFDRLPRFPSRGLPALAAVRAALGPDAGLAAQRWAVECLGATVECALRSVHVDTSEDLQRRLGSAQRLAFDGGGDLRAALALDGALVSELARMMARAPAATPAPATTAERGLVAYGLAWLLAALPGGLRWQLLERAPPVDRECLVLEVELALDRRPALVWLLLPPQVVSWPAVRPASSQARSWLAAATVDVAVQLARCWLPAIEVHGLALGDLLLFAGCPATLAGCPLRLAVAAGFYAATVDEAGLAITGRWTRDRSSTPSRARPREESRMGEESTLVDQLELELVVEFCRFRWPVGQLTSLDVGDVVALGRPLVAPLELRVGERLVGRAELVDVDGEAGLRIVDVYD